MSKLTEDQAQDRYATLSAFLAGPIEVGEPDVAGHLTVFPLIGPPARLDYRAFATASAAGTISIGELDGGASVNDLVVDNKGAHRVLLYEGEEVIGAQQNRVYDISILIEASSKTPIPVSCVEAGRWDGSRHRESFRPSRQAADPRMRKMKNRRVKAMMDAGMPARADQSEVWNEVAARSAELESHSATGAMSDIYEQRRDELGKLRDEIRLHDGQCGSVAVIGGRVAVLDFVGRPDVYSALHPAFVEGYALDALAQVRTRTSDGDDRAIDPATIRGFTLMACDASAQERRAGAGLGETARFATGAIEGSALVCEDELVQLTAFPTENGPTDDEPGRSPARARRINRPSRRRVD